ncbi:HET-domain-containing protein, partial [Cenococcum geophilum 1.58]|uniref:HET-domain-containing protein n=1 Tax=Cenococcum geophilum 1.58 TaxID=794803 RepID=UPI00358FB54D
MRPRDAIQCILPLARGPKLDGEKDRVLRCRPVNLAQVDFNLVRDWINTCQKGHKKCRRFMTSSRLMSMFGFSLIDVQREALVDAPRGAKYLALSYVWGSARQLKLKNEEIPKTIRDAIYVCKALHERYLWVDALCIIQDDEADKKAQISNMDLVYRNAYITIVGAVGDATTGLPGTRTNYPRREAVKASIQGLMLSSAPSELPEVLSRSLWATRGWTLQEQLMSRRLLVFTDRIVYFNCQETTFREDV